MESKAKTKTPSSPSVASFRSASSSRPETPDPYPYPLSPPRSVSTPITTPRFGSQRFAKESDKEPSFKPPQPRPKSPGSLSVASTAASSQPETSDVTPKLHSIRKATNIVRGKEDPKPVERSINRFSREPTKQKPDPKLSTRQVKSVVTKPRPASPSSASVTSAASSYRPDSPDSYPNNRTVSPLVRSRFPAAMLDFPAEAPPNLITSVAPGRSTSATKSRPGAPAMASAERRRTPSAKKREAEEEKGNEKTRGNNSGVVIGSSMVERMLNSRKSTATGKVTPKGEKPSKIRGM